MSHSSLKGLWGGQEGIGDSAALCALHKHPFIRETCSILDEAPDSIRQINESYYLGRSRDYGIIVNSFLARILVMLHSLQFIFFSPYKNVVDPGCIV